MTASAHPELVLSAVEAALDRGFGRLRFAPAIEDRYEADTRAARCRYLLKCSLFSLLMFNIFVVTDFTMVPDIAALAVLVRLGIVTPIGLAATWFIWRDPHPMLREATSGFCTVLTVGGILFLMLVSESPMRAYQHTGIVLVLLFPTIALRLRFQALAVTLLVCLVIHGFSVLSVPEIPPAIQQSAIMLLVGAAAFMLVASYRLDHQDRLFYLLTLRDRLRNEQLDRMSKTDPLTGLGNRRHMDQRLGDLWAAAAPQVQPICIVMLDIDRFKAFNDHHGHPAGDRCIVEVARCAVAALGDERHLAVRFGGEELLFVLADCDLAAGRRVAERIRAAVQNAGIAHVGGVVGGVVTVSLGVASAIPNADVAAAELIAAADAALYVAKQSGRNQVWPQAARRLESEDSSSAGDPRHAAASA